ncbi:MAG: DivIVA domain-containing protein [Ruminococcaceae bacterium]|nr:DivIVA domain-containing protein [Oscillospiraceae bacterium]
MPFTAYISMLAPHELKNTEFSKSLRGYSTVEVDEHIEFIIEKYTELYRLNDELEKKLRIVEGQLEALKAEEDSIKSTLVNAQKASTQIINEANERADVIMRSAKNSCDRMIAELQANVVKENERLRDAQRETASFKAALFEAYRDHIAGLEKIVPEIRIENNDDAIAEKLSGEVMERIRRDLTGSSELLSGSDDPFTPVNEEGDTVSGGSGSAEAPIPDAIDDDLQKPDEDAFTEARDSEQDFLSERTIILEKGESILDSIRKISNEASDDDDLFSMLDSVSKENDKSNSSNTDEFDVVYDGKK